MRITMLKPYHTPRLFRLEPIECGMEEGLELCSRCRQQLAHFAGPGSARGMICQTPGCDLEGVELELPPTETAINAKGTEQLHGGN